MEETTSFWNKRQEDLTVSDTIKVAAIAPALVAAAYLVPLVVIGKISEIRTNRKLRKEAVDTIVEANIVEEE